MPTDPITYFASFRTLELMIWESQGRHSWRVTHPNKALIAQGDAPDLESAMVAAAQAAQADWGSVKWRAPDEDEE